MFQGEYIKLEEALLKKRNILKIQITLKKILKNNIILKGDNINNEDPNILIKEYIEINNELSDLIVKINDVEYKTKLEVVVSVLDAINIREKLFKRDVYL